MSDSLLALRVGDFSIERDADPLDDAAPPIVRIVHDRCELRVDNATAFVLRGDERRVAVDQLRLLAWLRPGEVDLEAVGKFTAVARRLGASEGSVTFERFDDLARVETFAIQLADAEAIATAIERLIELGVRDPEHLEQP
ncbi:MAG: hypothetical protein WEF50_11180 [Myxococcota bacterium]